MLKCIEPQRQQTEGFTLIELVIVIVLIGIISATALPKFSDLTIQARNASNQGISSNLSGVLSVAHSTWVSNGAPNTLGGSTVVVTGQNFHVNSTGWPDNGKGYSPEASDCSVIWNTILNNPPIAGCKDCVQDCLPTSTNGCYITTAFGAVCTFSLATNAPITVTYDMSNGTVGFTSQ